MYTTDGTSPAPALPGSWEAPLTAAVDRSCNVHSVTSGPCSPAPLCCCSPPSAPACAWREASASSAARMRSAACRSSTQCDGQRHAHVVTDPHMQAHTAQDVKAVTDKEQSLYTQLPPQATPPPHCLTHLFPTSDAWSAPALMLLLCLCPVPPP